MLPGTSSSINANAWPTLGNFGVTVESSETAEVKRLAFRRKGGNGQCVCRDAIALLLEVSCVEPFIVIPFTLAVNGGVKGKLWREPKTSNFPMDFPMEHGVLYMFPKHPQINPLRQWLNTCDLFSSTKIWKKWSCCNNDCVKKYVHQDVYLFRA